MTDRLLELFDEYKKQIREFRFSHDLYSQLKEEAAQVKNQTIVYDLIQCLQDRTERSSIRSMAADMLGIIRDPIALPVLIEAVASDDEDELEIRYEAALALGEIGDKAAVQPLIQILKVDDKDSDDIRVFCKIVNALERIGDPSAAEPLLAALVDDYGGFDHHASYDYREMAASALIKLGDKNIANQLLILLTKPQLLHRKLEDENLRDTIARVLGGMRYMPAIPALLDLLRNVHFEYRCGIAYHLANFNDPRVIEALLATLNDPDENIRQCAKQALDQLGYIPQ